MCVPEITSRTAALATSLTALRRCESAGRTPHTFGRGATYFRSRKNASIAATNSFSWPK